MFIVQQHFWTVGMLQSQVGSLPGIRHAWRRFGMAAVRPDTLRTTPSTLPDRIRNCSARPINTCVYADRTSLKDIDDPSL